MIDFLNKLLSPLNSVVVRYNKYIRYFLLILSISTIGFLFFPNTTKESGEKAILVLWIILWIPILARVFWIQIAKTLLPIRKELGILMWMLAVVHGFWYIFSGDISFILQKSFWIYSWFLTTYAFWVFALTLTIPLLLTSNFWAIKLFGKNWKKLHKTVYIMAICTVAHVALIQWLKYLDFWPIIILSFYFIGKILEWKWIHFIWTSWIIKYQKWQKWICPPCGFIYDPTLWDEDSWILPGTEFTDIPNEWKCPVCWVAKSDFIPLTENQNTKKYCATLLEKNFLNTSTLEVIIELEESLESKVWQFVTFEWKDDQGVFKRQYSIANQSWNKITFLIKLNEEWRWAKVLRAIQVWDSLGIIGIFGNFLLEDTDSNKIFIATGTWLAPIYNMITTLPKESYKKLYFSVGTEKELFYIDKLKSIENLELHIHVTKEELNGYETGRVNLDNINEPIDAEFYLCGNPKMVSESIKKLQEKGYTNIYSEEF